MTTKTETRGVAQALADDDSSLSLTQRHTVVVPVILAPGKLPRGRFVGAWRGATVWTRNGSGDEVNRRCRPVVHDDPGQRGSNGPVSRFGSGKVGALPGRKRTPSPSTQPAAFASNVGDTSRRSLVSSLLYYVATSWQWLLHPEVWWLYGGEPRMCPSRSRQFSSGRTTTDGACPVGPRCTRLPEASRQRQQQRRS